MIKTTDGTGKATAGAATGLVQIVSFRLGAEEFGLEILKVQEIIRVQELTRVPNLPVFVEGVINLRGKVIPVIGLRRCFGLESHEHDKGTRIMVVEVRGAVLGFIVDSVSEVLRIPSHTVEPPPQSGKLERDYLVGVSRLGDRMVLLLNLDRLLTRSGILQCEAMEA
jgi:purine-binding chemotaxis protein CheW